MRVLVTGGSGYLGGAVVRHLLEAGHHVGVLVHRSETGIPSDAELHHGDLLDSSTLLPAVRGVDAVVHLAAISRVRESLAQPARYFRLNVGGTASLLEALSAAAASKSIVPSLVFASSGSVYGKQERQPIKEETQAVPENPYTSSKLMAERVIGWQASAGLLAAASLRIFNIAGAEHGHGDVDDTRLIPRAIAAACGQAGPLEIYGDGSAVRDYVHVSDVADAFVHALDHVEAGQHTIYNVGATPASVRDIVGAVGAVTGVEVPVQRHPQQPGEVNELRADTARIRSVGWLPRFSEVTRIVADQWAATSV